MTGLTDALRQDFRVMKVCKLLTVGSMSLLELSYIMMQIYLLDYDSLSQMQAFTTIDSHQSSR